MKYVLELLAFLTLETGRKDFLYSFFLQREQEVVTVDGFSELNVCCSTVEPKDLISTCLLLQIAWLLCNCKPFRSGTGEVAAGAFCDSSCALFSPDTVKELPITASVSSVYLLSVFSWVLCRFWITASQLIRSGPFLVKKRNPRGRSASALVVSAVQALENIGPTQLSVSVLPPALC